MHYSREMLSTIKSNFVPAGRIEKKVGELLSVLINVFYM